METLQIWEAYWNKTYIYLNMNVLLIMNALKMNVLLECIYYILY